MVDDFVKHDMPGGNIKSTLPDGKKQDSPKVDVEDIMVKIRKEIASKHNEPFEQHKVSPEALHLEPGEVTEFQHLIVHAEGEIDVGSQVTQMEHFRSRIIRYFAVLTGKIIIYLSRFITARQRRYNRHVVDALKKVLHIYKKLINTIDSIKNAQVETKNSLEELSKAHDEIRAIIEQTSNTNKETRLTVEGLSVAHHETRTLLEGVRIDYRIIENSLQELIEDNKKTKAKLDELQSLIEP